MPGPSFTGFMKKNVKFSYGGAAGAAFFGLPAVANVLTSNNKFGALLKLFKDLALARVGLVGTFVAVGGAIRALVRDTGSLEAAMKRLSLGQQFARQLAPFVGGMGVAAKRVSELMAISSRGVFSFPELADANKKLETYTRGTFSSTDATKSIGEVAIATGNDIGEVASAVGDFYSNLREGQPIDRAAEHLREMGAISQSTADRLVRMSNSGAGANAVFSELTSNLEKTARAGAATGKGDVKIVRAKHEAVIETAKAAFGEGFIESEIENTKNYTSAIQALTPAIGETGSFLAKMFNGFSTVVSVMTKFAAQSGVAEVALKLIVATLTAAVVAITAIGVTAIPEMILGVASATAAWGLLGTVITAAVGATGIGAAAIAVIGLGVALYKLNDVSSRTAKELQQQAEAHKEAQTAIDAQIASVVTLTDKHEALAKAIKNVVALETERRQLAADLEKHTVQRESSQLHGARKRLSPEEQADQKKLEQNQNALDQARTSVRLAGATAGISPQSQEMARAEAQARFTFENERIEAQMSNASPERRIDLMKQQKAMIDARQARAMSGLQFGAGVAERRSSREAEVAPTQAELEADEAEQKKLTDKGKEVPVDLKNRIATNQEKVAQSQTDSLKEGLAAPQFSSVFLDTKVQQQLAAKQAQEAEAIAASGGPGAEDAGKTARQARERAGGEVFDPKRLQELQVQKEQAKTIEEGAGQYGAQSVQKQAEIDAATRELAITMSRVSAEKEIASLKGEGADRAVVEYAIRKRQIAEELAILRAQASPNREEIGRLETQGKQLDRQEQLRQRGLQFNRAEEDTDIAAHKARRSGNLRGAVRLRDLGDFQKEFQSELAAGFGAPEAKERATAKSEDTIREEVFNRPAVVDSLQTIGLGGNVGGSDPGLEVQRRIEQLHRTSSEYLKEIRDIVTNPVKGGRPAVFQ